MIITGKTDKGKKRSRNEDIFFVDPELGLMIVADGMGGHDAGDVASSLATKVCSNQVKISLKTGHVPVFKHVEKKPDYDSRACVLGDCVKFSNMAVYEASHQKGGNKNMGTTMVAALWMDGKLAIANVGDSRLYMFRNGDLTQCTYDHSFIQDQIDRGLIRPEDAEKSEMRNMLTRSIGMNEDVDVDLNEVSLAEGDYILLCSDGLTKMLDDDQIESTFQANRPPEEISEELIARANEAGGLDNVTVVVAKVENNKPSISSITNKVKGMFKKDS